MTEREALKLALEALEKSHICPLLPDDCAEAITAIKEALAQPEHGWTPERITGMARLKDAQDKRLAQPETLPWTNKMSIDVPNQILYTAPQRKEPEQEPVACIEYVPCCTDQTCPKCKATTPPQRTWVGLTDEEVESLQRLAIDPVDANGWGFLNRERYANLIEAKLKEKNT